MLGFTALLACLRFVEPAYALLYSILLIIAAVTDATGRRHPPGSILNVVSVGILVVSVMRMRIDTFIIVFTEAILLMTAVKILEEKRARDYFQIAALVVFTVISAAIDAIDGTFIYYCVLVSVLAGFELMLGTWFARDPDGELSLRELSQIVGKSIMIWIMMLPLCVTLFFAAPRARLTLGQLPPLSGQESRVGFTERMTLGSVRAIQEDGSLAFRASMPQVAPKDLYWRGIVMSIFDGRAWSVGARGRSEHIASPGEQTVKQDIFMESGRYMSAVFALDVPIMVDTPGISPAGDGVFLNTNYRNRVRSYTVISSLSDRLRTTGDFTRDHVTNIPRNFSPKLENLANAIVLGLSDEEKPDAIMKHLLSPEFSYTMSDLPVSSHPLDYFVFTWKKGNCEYFAAAMAVMLRMTGVPARLVSGYHGGVYNDGGGYYMVSQSNAHVWVEAWSERESAWIRYNPTPASAEAGDEADESVNYGTLRMYIDYVNYQLSRIFLEYGGDSQMAAIEAIRGIIASPGGAMASALDDLRNIGRNFYAASIAVILFAGALFARYLRRGAARGKISREEAIRGKFLDAMRQRGFEKKNSEGLEEFVDSVRKFSRGAEIYEPAARFVSSFGGIYFRDRRMTDDENRGLNALIDRIKKNRRS
jgi:hypothetical protein